MRVRTVLAVGALAAAAAVSPPSSGQELPRLPLPQAKLGGEGFHQYAIVGSARTSGVRGLRVRRMDGAVAQRPAAQLCPRTGGWVFATQWLSMPGGFLELGTGYACTGAVITYWGHGDATGWHWDGIVSTTARTTARPHVYEIRYLAGGRWRASVDGAALGTIPWATTAAGTGGQTGLESYTASAFVSGMSMTAVKVLRSGSWQPLPGPVRASIDRDMTGAALPDGSGIAPGQLPTVS